MRGATTINLGACVGLKETIGANHLVSSPTDRYRANEFFGKNFYDGTNYRSALQRLDGGYEIALDFVGMMQEFCDQEKEQARRLIAYADKWTNHLKQQPSLVSYHTTKRAQLDLLGVPRELAKLKESTCVEMQQVIDKYRHYLNETYITERLRPGRRHRRSHEFKRAFKVAHASLSEVSDELDTLFVQERKAREALRVAESTCEIFELDAIPNEKYIARARDAQNKKRSALENIQEQIEKNKEKMKAAQKVYQRKATEIFKQCQSVEEERLDHIRETLLDFIQAIHPTSYSQRLDEIIEKVSERITKHQNSFDDLLFWAKAYGVDKKLTKDFVSTVFESDEDIEENEKIGHSDNDDNEDESLTDDISENRAKKKSHSNHRDKHSSKNVDHEKQRHSGIDDTLTPVKTQRRRKKSISTTEKKTTTPTTHVNNSVLNQV